MKYTSDLLGTILGEYNSGHAYPIGKRVNSGMRWRSTVRLSRMMRSRVAHAAVCHHNYMLWAKMKATARPTSQRYPNSRNASTRKASTRMGGVRSVDGAWVRRWQWWLCEWRW